MFSILLPALLVASLAAGEVRVRVTAEHAALRLQNSDNVAVACQVDAGQELTLLGPLEGNWVPVSPPADVSFWIYSELVRKGRVVADKAQVRSGGGLSYGVIGSLDRNTPVDSLGRLGDWLKIKPPPTLPLWISRAAIEPVSNAKPSEIVSLSPALAEGLLTALITSNALATTSASPVPSPVATTGVSSRVSASRPPLPTELHGFRLTSEPLQGRRMRFVGTLRPAFPGATATPAKYRLSGIDRSGGWVTFCHLIGPEAQLASQTGRRLQIDGIAWWLTGESFPILQVESIAAQP